jgi:HAD superfamily hydrolase (TIGR01459 family)
VPVQVIGGVSELSGRYDAVLCDVWGVIHDGVRTYPGAADALRALRAAGLVVVLVSNVPRPGSTMPRALARLGFPVDAWDAIVTSGDVIRDELAARAPGPVLRLGRATDTGLWEGLDLDFVDDPADAAFLAIAGLRDRHDVPQEYSEVLAAARHRGLELLCANPDLQVQHGRSLQWCAGSVAALYEGIGGAVVQAGKPHRPIYDRALDLVEQVAGRSIPTDRVLAIGDGILTDLPGAAARGIDSLFIATGMHGDALLAGSEVDLDRARAAVAAVGTSATWVMPQLT